MATSATRHPRSPAKVRKSSRQKALSGNEVRTLRQRYGLSQALLSRLLDVSLRTVSGAESDPTTPAQLRRNLTQANRLCDALGEAMEPAFVGHWLDQPNEMLSGLKPVEAIERGQLDLVWQVVEGLRSGSPL
jgi:transcriptional regulator with XRE-family HTH domain